jgi:hypothetical protein
MNRQGESAWPDKYVKIDADAAAVNADIADPGKREISLERKRRELNNGGRHVYEVEMLFDPVAAGSPFFDRATIERLIARSALSRRERKRAFTFGRNTTPRIATRFGLIPEKATATNIARPSSSISRRCSRGGRILREQPDPRGQPTIFTEGRLVRFLPYRPEKSSGERGAVRQILA